VCHEYVVRCTSQDHRVTTACRKALKESPRQTSAAATERALPVMRIMAGKHAPCDMSERARGEAREMRGSDREREREECAKQKVTDSTFIIRFQTAHTKHARTHLSLTRIDNALAVMMSPCQSQARTHAEREGQRVVRMAWKHDLV
jgi:hypothetical protein